MKKIRLLVLLSIFTMAISSNVLAEESLETYQERHSSSWEKYDVYSSNSIKSRSILSEEESLTYDLIYDALINLDDFVYLPNGDMSIDEVFDIVKKVLNDHVDIFYVQTGIRYWTDGKVEFTYVYPKGNIDEMRNELDNKVSSILEKIIKPNMSDFEKELAIHDYLVLNTRYGTSGAAANSYNAYGALIKGVTMCEGYSESFKWLLGEVGIDSIIVSSQAMKHAWNIVTIDDENYHVDVTWDDPVPDREGKVRYKYLNLTDNKIMEDHNWDYYKYPSCISEDYSAYWEIDSPKNYDKIYYVGITDRFIYSLDKNFQKKQITNVRAPYFDLAGEYIYFSNYDRGGYLSKIRKDGSGSIDELNSANTMDIYREGSYIYYTEKLSKLKKKIEVDIGPTEIKVESISLDKKELVLKEGETSKLTQIINPSNASNKDVTWTSSDSSVARVDKDGNIKAISQGQANIIVSTIDGAKTASCIVMVEEDYSEYSILKEEFDVELSKPWTIKFNKDVDSSSVNNKTIYILDENKNSIDLNYNTIGKQVILTPKQDYDANKKYTIFISKGVKSGDNQLKQPIMKEFNTRK